MNESAAAAITLSPPHHKITRHIAAAEVTSSCSFGSVPVSYSLRLSCFDIESY
jgi:hypothetical protein